MATDSLHSYLQTLSSGDRVKFLESLRPLAWAQAARNLDALIQKGTLRRAADSLGLSKAAVARSLDALFRKATQQGVGPHFVSPAAVPAGLQVKGTSTLFNDQGQVSQQWIKTREQSLAPEQLIEFFSDAVPARSPIKPLSAQECRKRPHAAKADVLPVLMIPEPHIGMKAWADECGENYDLDIARGLILRAVDYLLDAAAPNGADQMMILDPGDFYHYSSRKPETEQSKHYLASDGRWPKVIETGIDIYREVISRAAARCKKLDVIRVRGNHDPDWSFWLDCCMRGYFRNSSHITIDTQPTKSKMYQFGKTMLMVDHGDLNKHDDLGAYMANEWPEVWGQTQYRYIWTGHIHHRDAKEMRGCTWESVNSLAAKDDFHTDNKYQSLRSMMLVKYHRQWGEIGRELFRPGM